MFWSLIDMTDTTAETAPPPRLQKIIYSLILDLCYLFDHYSWYFVPKSFLLVVLILDVLEKVKYVYAISVQDTFRNIIMRSTNYYMIDDKNKVPIILASLSEYHYVCQYFIPNI